MLQFLHQVHDPGLMGQIQCSSGFVQKHDFRVLADGPCNKDPLAFTTTELMNFAVCQALQIGKRQCFFNRTHVGLFFKTEQALMGCPAHHHHLGNSEREIHTGLLTDDGNGLGQTFLGISRQRFVFYFDFTMCRFDKPCHGIHQC